MEKEFVPFEQALALKDLGFDEPCFGFSRNDRNDKKLEFTNIEFAKNFNEINSKDLFFSKGEDLYLFVSRPTFSQAFKWFRKKYGLHPHIFSREDGAFIWCVRWYVDGLQKDIPYDSSNTYEEAELKCLKKLIEIIKQK